LLFLKAFESKKLSFRHDFGFFLSFFWIGGPIRLRYPQNLSYKITFWHKRLVLYSGITSIQMIPLKNIK
jgi:hypothetical protein